MVPGAVGGAGGGRGSGALGGRGSGALGGRGSGRWRWGHHVMKLILEEAVYLGVGVSYGDARGPEDPWAWSCLVPTSGPS